MDETPSPLSQGANVPLTGVLTCDPDTGSVAIPACLQSPGWSDTAGKDRALN